MPVTMVPTGNNAASASDGPVVTKEWSWVQTAAVVPLSRKVFRKWLAKLEASHYEEDATLCFMELLTNAIRIDSPDGMTETKWILTDNKLRVEVKDFSENAPWRQNPDSESESGRGLILVHLLADKWGYDHCAFMDERGVTPGKWVWFELHK
ncbi:ATP-binding protein [Streptomyces sp. NPDC006798]|uniref:ATP-binding protein n=1 Tax=unclassified Streptomyces TaxID=2593676 RepID=UPI0033FFB756